MDVIWTVTFDITWSITCDEKVVIKSFIRKLIKDKNKYILNLLENVYYMCLLILIYIYKIEV